jgi:hypothetical protein
MGTLKVARFFKAFAPIRACPIGATRVGEIQKTSSQPRTPHSSSAGGGSVTVSVEEADAGPWRRPQRGQTSTYDGCSCPQF